MSEESIFATLNKDERCIATRYGAYQAYNYNPNNPRLADALPTSETAWLPTSEAAWQNFQQASLYQRDFVLELGGIDALVETLRQRALSKPKPGDEAGIFHKDEALALFDGCGLPVAPIPKTPDAQPDTARTR